MVEVHDDATPDDSVERVVAQFDDPRLKYIRYPDNAGIVGNFTRSLLGAETEYVIQLGDDDVAEPLLVERTVAALDRYPSAGMVHSRFALIDAAGDVLVADEDWLGTPSPPLEPGRDVHRALDAARLARLHVDGADPALGGAGGRLPPARPPAVRLRLLAADGEDVGHRVARRGAVRATASTSAASPPGSATSPTTATCRPSG